MKLIKVVDWEKIKPRAPATRRILLLHVYLAKDDIEEVANKEWDI